MGNKETFRKLGKEQEHIEKSIKSIMLFNNFKEEEKKELWDVIWELAENQLKQEKFCNI